MGQKVNPHALRTGIIKDWDSKWYDEDYGEPLIVDPTVKIGVIRQLASHESTSAKPAVAKNRVSFNYSKVRQFIRAVMQRINERLVLPPNKLLFA